MLQPFNESPGVASHLIGWRDASHWNREPPGQPSVEINLLEERLLAWIFRKVSISGFQWLESL